MLKIAKTEEEHAELKFQHANNERQAQKKWLEYLLKTFRKEGEMAEQQLIEVLLGEMLEQQTEVLAEEEEQTQILYEFDVFFVIADGERRAKRCLVRKNRRNEDDD